MGFAKCLDFMSILVSRQTGRDFATCKPSINRIRAGGMVKKALFAQVETIIFFKELPKTNEPKINVKKKEKYT